MALANLKFFSETLGIQTEVYVILPQKNIIGQIGGNSSAPTGPYKCLYLLHGLSDDNSMWLRRTSIERYADAYGFCVIMPHGAKSFYTDMKYGEKYYTYISQELPRIIQEFFHVSARREDTYIAGLSMGGYGALKIGLRNGNMFSAAAGLSPVIHPDFEGIPEGILTPIYGEDQIIPEEDNLLYLIEKQDGALQKPKLFIAIGTEDFLYKDNKIFREKIQTLHYDFTYLEAPGSHCWEFWDTYIQHILKWFSQL